ncbi:hypothetical protein RLOC_00010031 [Lonchura striata]|uniref:Uncharacterized protein n=1 Tax=Lonchura striata TaxID=40157 RepID=A0A218UJ58_9PASE|nr:hypothetical protein RLOC_00010031 [Lonchura striata domestica]
MSRAAEVMVQHVENLKRHQAREHAELEEMKRLIQQNSRNRQLAETQGEAGSGMARSSPAGFGPEPLGGDQCDPAPQSRWWYDVEPRLRPHPLKRTFQQHYWVFFWLLLLSIAFLLLVRALELQRLQSAASSKA